VPERLPVYHPGNRHEEDADDNEKQALLSKILREVTVHRFSTRSLLRFT
jgi:hypothetical protein